MHTYQFGYSLFWFVMLSHARQLWIVYMHSVAVISVPWCPQSKGYSQKIVSEFPKWSVSIRIFLLTINKTKLFWGENKSRYALKKFHPKKLLRGNKLSSPWFFFIIVVSSLPLTWHKFCYNLPEWFC